jgi:hypothetical protein
MEVIVAVSLSTDSCTFHEKADVEFIRHTDATMHLNTLFSGIAHDF